MKIISGFVVAGLLASGACSGEGDPSYSLSAEFQSEIVNNTDDGQSDSYYAAVRFAAAEACFNPDLGMEDIMNATLHPTEIGRLAMKDISDFEAGIADGIDIAKENEHLC